MTTPLMAAIESKVSGTGRAATLLIRDERADLATLDEQHHSALHYTHGERPWCDAELFATLVEREDAKLNIADEDGDTILHRCAAEGQVDQVEILLRDRRTDVNVRNKDGKTPILLLYPWFALERLRIVELFLHKRAVDVHAADTLGNSYLHRTLRHISKNLPSVSTHKCKEAIKTFVSSCKRTVWGQPNMDGVTSAMLLATTSRRMMRKLLFSDNCPDLSRLSSARETVLHFAASRDTVTRPLCRRVSNVSAQNVDGYSALHIAIEKGHIRSARFIAEFLSSGDMNQVTMCGETAAMIARRVLNVSLRLILESDDVNTLKPLHADMEDTYGDTSLHDAVRNNEVTRSLCRAVLDVNAQNKHGETALHIAAAKSRKCINSAKFILDSSAQDVDINLKDYYGDTPVMIAAKRSKKMLRLILGLARVPLLPVVDLHRESALHIAARHNTITDSLCRNVTNVNARNIERETAIEIAVKQNDVDGALRILRWATPLVCVSGSVFSFLLEQEHLHPSCPIDAANNTLLHFAVHAGVLTQSLCHRASNINVQNADGDTVLHWAAARGDVKSTRILLLGTHSPQQSPAVGVNLRNSSGETPGIVAAKKSVTVMSMIVNHEEFDPRASIDARGNSLLHVAAEHGAVTKKLCRKYGSAANSVNDDGDTALHAAVRRADLGVVDKLLRFTDASVYKRNRAGMSPLDIAREMRERGIFLRMRWN